MQKWARRGSKSSSEFSKRTEKQKKMGNRIAMHDYKAPIEWYQSSSYGQFQTDVARARAPVIMEGKR